MPKPKRSRTAVISIANCLLLTIPFLVLGQQPANSNLALHESFDQPKFGDGWKSVKGVWKITDGALVGRESPHDNHAAMIVREAETGNAVYEFKFMFSENAESIQIGFTRGHGETDQASHPFSFSVTPDSCLITKLDTQPKGPGSQIVAKQKQSFAADRWHDVRITTWGPYVTAKIDKKITLTASDQSFATKKPAIAFRCSGGPVEIDDIQIWTQR